VALRLTPRLDKRMLIIVGISTRLTGSRWGSSCGGCRSPAGTIRMNCGRVTGVPPGATPWLMLTASFARVATPETRPCLPGEPFLLRVTEPVAA
jgi:hypothetical protein